MSNWLTLVGLRKRDKAWFWLLFTLSVVALIAISMTALIPDVCQKEASLRYIDGDSEIIRITTCAFLAAQTLTFMQMAPGIIIFAAATAIMLLKAKALWSSGSGWTKTERRTGPRPSDSQPKSRNRRYGKSSAAKGRSDPSSQRRASQAPSRNRRPR